MKSLYGRQLHRVARWVAWTLASFFALVVVLYLVAVVDKQYEARRAMRVYNQVLTVRLGDTVAEFNRKAPGCKIDTTDGEHNCLVEPVVQRILHPVDWYMMHAHEEAYLWQSTHRQNIGLRDWHFVLWVTVREGRVNKMYAQFFVVGRGMMVGCSWGLAPEVRGIGQDTASAGKPSISTALSVTHITSSWVGWGYRMGFTPSSNEHDLRMREINASCLTSLTGCRDSRELLPNLPPPEHPRYW